MKKLFAVLTALLFVLAACGNNEEDTKKDSKTLTVGTEGTYAPFTFHDKDGKLTGYDVEVTEAVAKKRVTKLSSLKHSGIQCSQD